MTACKQWIVHSSNTSEIMDVFSPIAIPYKIVTKLARTVKNNYCIHITCAATQDFIASIIGYFSCVCAFGDIPSAFFSCA